MFLTKFSMLCSILSSIVSYVLSAECQIDPFRLKSPLLINTRDSNIIYPAYATDTIGFNTDDVVEFVCPDEEVIFGELKAPVVVRATCMSDGRFDIMGRHFFWKDVLCSNEPVSKARFMGGWNSGCGANAKLVEVGFDLGRRRFLTLMHICFDTLNEIPLYSRYEIPSIINFGPNLNERPFFSQDEDFYRAPNMDFFYTRRKQRATINRLLGLEGGSVKYIKDGGSFFLSRGHLAAKKDFFYEPAQRATFRLINAAPQWQPFNGANWNQVEIDTRNYASNHQLNLLVWTGTYGVDTLPHEYTNEEVPLCLNNNGHQTSLVVPGIYWRIVYDDTNNKGIVLIGLNNPYKIDQRYNDICPDVSWKASWLHWDQYNMQKGYSYACTISNFMYAVQSQLYIPDVPDIGELNLLT